MTNRQSEFREFKFDGKTKKPAPLLDVAKLKIPETVALCGHCLGHAQFVQRWCDAPPSPGACDMCGGAQFVYAGTGKKIPRSVRDQIQNMNPELVVSDRWPTAYRVGVDYGGRLLHKEDIG